MTRLRPDLQLELSTTPGSLLLSDVSNKYNHLAPGANGEVLSVVAGVPTYTSFVESPFESSITDTVIREAANANQYNRDFVVGSPTLDYTTEGNRMFFNKSKGAFRVGRTLGTEWDDVNVGDVSTAIGDNTQATGNRSYSIGHNSVAYLNSMVSNASGRFATNGDAQESKHVVRNETIDATPGELFIEQGTGDEQRVLIPANRTWGFIIKLTARQTAGSAGTVGDSAFYIYKGVIKRDGADNTVIAGSITEEIIVEDNVNWSVAVTADDVNESLKIEVTGGLNQTIHWVAKVELVEVG